MPPRSIRYATDADSLFFPGRADDFFPLGPGVSEGALCAEMARAAYIKHEGPSEKVRLSAILGRVGFTVVDHLDADGTQGFIADGQTHEGRAIRVIAFRGTEPDDPRDLLADIQAWGEPWHGGASVHAGFAEALSPVRQRVMSAIDASQREVVVTGHSLGAALATLVASVRPSTRLYTFGSPRVGNAAFAAMIDPARQWRYVDYVDAVTTVPPPLSGLGYVHLEPASFIDADGVVKAGLSDAEIRERQARAGGRGLDVGAILTRFAARNATDEGGIPLRDLTDHAPINYVAALMGLPA
jgi:hypothetical protein